jgi:hypothetical protein
LVAIRKLTVGDHIWNSAQELGTREVIYFEMNPWSIVLFCFNMSSVYLLCVVNVLLEYFVGCNQLLVLVLIKTGWCCDDPFEHA